MAAVTEHSTTIDGVTYRTRTYPATEAIDLLQRLARIVGEKVLALVMQVEDAEASLLAREAAVMVAIVSGAAERAAPGEFSQLAKSLLHHTTSDQVRIGETQVPGSVVDHFDTHFSGRYRHLLEVCIWAARLGFGGP